MRRRTPVTVILALLLVVLWLFGCSSGGDGGDTASRPDPTPAGPTNTFDADAVDSVVRGLSDMGIGCTMNGGASFTTAMARSMSSASQDIADHLRGAYFKKQTMGTMATEVFDEVIEGTCPGNPGQLRIHLTSDDVAGTFAGNFDFDNFCIEADASTHVRIDGGANFSGQFVSDDVNGGFISFSLNAGTSPSGIVICTPETNATIAVTGLSIAFNQVGEGFNLNFSLASASVSVFDGNSTQNIAASNVTLAVSENNAGDMTATVNGTFNNSGGSMVVSTPDPLRINEAGDVMGGQVLIQGAGGTAVRITHAGYGYAFDVAADTNGNGAYDGYSAVMDCSDIGGSLPVF